MHWGLDDRDPTLLSGSGVPCSRTEPLSWRAGTCQDIALADVTHWWQGYCHLLSSEPPAGWLCVSSITGTDSLQCPLL